MASHRDSRRFGDIRVALRGLRPGAGFSQALIVLLTLFFSEHHFDAFKLQRRRIETAHGIGTRVIVDIPNAFKSALPIVLALLLVTMMMSLAAMAMSSFLPLMIAPMLTRNSSRLPSAFSRKMMPWSRAALKFVPWASEIACRNVVPSFSGNEPGALTSPATKKTSLDGMLIMSPGSSFVSCSKRPLSKPLMFTLLSSYLGSSSLVSWPPAATAGFGSTAPSAQGSAGVVVFIL